MKIKSKRKASIVFILVLIVGIIIIKLYKDKNSTVAFANNLVPKALSYEEQLGEFILSKETSIYIEGKTPEETEEIYKIAEYIQAKMKASTGYDLKILKDGTVPEGNILLTTIGGEDSQGDEGYTLTSSTNEVKLIANKPKGLFMGIQTLRQLLPTAIEKSTLVTDTKWVIPAVTIKDKPEYAYRGLMLDVARHFFTVEDVKRQIDLAATYKINTLHLHLTDDQGWRLHINSYPDLTAIGGRNEVGGGKGGFYTQEDFKDIVKYAADRYIDIIPEIDMPGHTNAALASYGFLNPNGLKKAPYTGIEVGFSTLNCRSESTYTFVESIIKEISAISPSKYIHIGGDEAKVTSKEDYNYFMAKVNKILNKYGKTAIGWSPSDTAPALDSSFVLQQWTPDNSAAKEKAMKMIISPPQKAYLDMKYSESTPYGTTWAGIITVKSAYNWDPTDYAPKELILGVESPLWTETIPDNSVMDYMIYPRLLGHAEIGWTPKEGREWKNYKERLKHQGERLENMGVNYYKDSSVW